MPEPRKLRVFLSCGLHDKPIAHAFYQRLMGEGWIDPWLDDENLVPGQDRELELKAMFASTDVALICISKQSLEQDGYFQREIETLIEIAREKLRGSIFIIPILLDDCDIPQSLRSWLPVDFKTSDIREPTYQRLIKALWRKFEIVSAETAESHSARWASAGKNRKLKVFLCCASQDKPIARELYDQLIVENWIEPWLDEEKLYPGQDWDIATKRAIEVADAVIVLVSKKSLTKEGYIEKELSYTIDVAFAKPLHTTFVVPVRLDECQTPRQFIAWQWLDYFPEQEKDGAYQRLMASLAERALNIGIETEELNIPYNVAKKLWPDYKPGITDVQEEVLGRVFISYSRKDIDFARLLATDLQRNGFDVWWDISDLQGGDNWVRSIQDALDKSKYCLVVITPDGLNSLWVEREYTYAINNNLKVIPVFLKTCRVPFAFSTTQYIDFRQNRYTVAVQELFTALKNNLKS